MEIKEDDILEIIKVNSDNEYVILIEYIDIATNSEVINYNICAKLLTNMKFIAPVRISSRGYTIKEQTMSKGNRFSCFIYYSFSLKKYYIREEYDDKCFVDEEILISILENFLT